MGKDGRWIDDFVDADSGYIFTKVAAGAELVSWHQRGSFTGLRQWKQHFAHAYRALAEKPDVIIANFPQLIFAVCFLKMCLFIRCKVVGWSFNVGAMRKRWFVPVLGMVFKNASVLICHSNAEIDTYERIFGLPTGLVRFVPLQRGRLSEKATPEAENLIIAMGSAERDYQTLFAAVAGMKWKVIVVAKEDAVLGLDIPENVDVRSGLSMPECLALASEATVMALPIENDETASGQVTFLSAMAMKLPLVVTRCPGTEDYLNDGEDALLVPHNDIAVLRKSLAQLMDDPDLRRSLSDAAYQKWNASFSDEAAGRNLKMVLDDLTRSPRDAT